MENSGRELLPELKAMIPVANSIVATFGKNCEVVIHDLRYPDSSLVYMVGNVTNRSLGAPVTNIVLEALRNTGDKSEDLHCYKTVTKDGRTLKSSTTFIRDSLGKIIGCICINFDLTEFYLGKNIFAQFTEFPFDNEKNANKQEYFAQDVNDVIGNIIKQVIDTSKVPVSLMQKEEKVHIVQELDKKGVFLVKGAVDQVAAVLGVSRYTVYNYLDEIRSYKSGINVV